MALRRGDDDVDAKAGAFVLAELVLLGRAALIGLLKKR
jgi:hypothetical protein